MSDSAGEWVRVARLADVDERYPSRVAAGDVDLVLCRVGDFAFALDNLCSHAFAYLSDGYVENGQVFCPLHDGSFDLATGEAREPPCREAIAAHPTRVEGGDVYVFRRTT